MWSWGECWTEGFFVWNWRISRAEKEWPFCAELMCWTEGGVELRGTLSNLLQFRWMKDVGAYARCDSSSSYDVIRSPPTSLFPRQFFKLLKKLINLIKYEWRRSRECKWSVSGSSWISAKLQNVSFSKFFLTS